MKYIVHIVLYFNTTMHALVRTYIANPPQGEEINRARK